jgi:ankyrin repeat protein
MILRRAGGYRLGRTAGRTLAAFLGGLAVLFAVSGAAVGQGLFDADPIYGYARNGDIGAIRYLLKKGASVDTPSPSGETILMIAAGNGDLAMVDVALNNGARADREDKFGKTALCWAVERGHSPVAERLLKAGANINHQTQDGLTPVMLAVRANQLSMLQLLLRRKPDLTVLDYTGRGALGWARESRDNRAESMLRRAGAKD